MCGLGVTEKNVLSAMVLLDFDVTGCEMTDKRIDLDPNELLGLCQVLKVSGEQADASQNARVLSKVGSEVESDANRLNARLLSKAGGGDGGEVPNPPRTTARLLSKIGDGEVR